MGKQRLDVHWYRDYDAINRNEPGIVHSYMVSLATALHFMNGSLDPAWLMGSSAFAFRIYVNEVFCPSSMSVFNFSAILPEAMEQAGYRAQFFGRFWDEEEKEKEKRQQAQAAIIEAIDRNIPSIVWDIYQAEWGLIIGYDTKKRTYETMTNAGNLLALPFTKLGRNGINILAVTLPAGPNLRNRRDMIANALKAAVAHAGQKEWTDRPKYQNGLPAFDLWASLLEKWAVLVDGGKGDGVNSKIPDFASYYADHYYSARCYARDYLKAISTDSKPLLRAANCYEKVASDLKAVADYFTSHQPVQSNSLRQLSQKIRDAKTSEEEGIKNIQEFLRNEAVE
jgi:hypothetical protein